MSTRRERQALREIIQSIDAIDVYMRSLPTLPDMGIDAIKYQLVIIGEAVARVSEQTRDPLLAEIVPLSDPLPSVVGQEGERDEGSDPATATRTPGSMSGDGEGSIPGPPGGGPGAA